MKILKLEMALELDDRLNNKHRDFRRKNLQKKFWDIYEKNLEKYNAKHLHGKFWTHSSKFLKANDYFLE